MEVIIRRDAEAASQLAAALVAAALTAKPRLVLGLSTGRTLERLYGLLVEQCRSGQLDFSLASAFGLYEYVGLSPDAVNSCRSYLSRHLFQSINMDPRRAHFPNPTAPDLEAECRRFENEIKEFGGIDVQLLNIGLHGQIAWNEPLSAMQSRTRCKALMPDIVADGAHMFEDHTNIPRRAITMGVGTILESKRCLLLVTGAEKADIVAKAVEGPITSMLSASALQLHQRCTVIVDEAAAAQLEQREYYTWIFENESEWAPFR
jgi:glucosamine-6-phosphate deaminase